ncbi:MAG: OmpA family protein, partial [Alphaproteobacteria bacterium]
LRVTVQDEDGKLLEAEVGLEGPELRVGNTLNGVFALDGLAPGTYAVRVSRPDYETGATVVNVVAGQVVSVTVVLTQPETRLTIITLDYQSGQRLPGTIVFWPGQPTEQTVDNAGGEYSTLIQPGTVTFTAVAENHESVLTTVEVAKAKVNIVTVRLRKKIQTKGRIFFEFDSAQLRPESFEVLDDVARQVVEQNVKRMVIEGHCSSEGTDEYNMALSRRRADSVRDYLVARGVESDILIIRAYGEMRPIATNETEEGRERNRRVEFIIEEE